MRRGYDLPPLNFDQEEIEALRVGLLLLSRTGDSMLQKAASRIFEKVDVLHGPADWLQVTPWGAPTDDAELGCISISMLREAIRNEQKLELTYRDEHEIETQRVIRPIALSYRSTCILLAGWCELRSGLRHFRTDRITGATNSMNDSSDKATCYESCGLSLTVEMRPTADLQVAVQPYRAPPNCTYRKFSVTSRDTISDARPSSIQIKPRYLLPGRTHQEG